MHFEQMIPVIWNCIVPYVRFRTVFCLPTMEAPVIGPPTLKIIISITEEISMETIEQSKIPKSIQKKIEQMLDDVIQHCRQDVDRRRMHASKGSLRNDRRSLERVENCLSHYDQNRRQHSAMFSVEVFTSISKFLWEKKMAKSEIKSTNRKNVENHAKKIRCPHEQCRRLANEKDQLRHTRAIRRKAR